MKINTPYNPSFWDKKEINKPAEPQTPPVVGSGSPMRKSPESASQEDKRVNQSKPSKKRQLPKTTLEILMEED